MRFHRAPCGPCSAPPPCATFSIKSRHSPLSIQSMSSHARPSLQEEPKHHGDAAARLTQGLVETALEAELLNAYLLYSSCSKEKMCLLKYSWSFSLA